MCVHTCEFIGVEYRYIHVHHTCGGHKKTSGVRLHFPQHILFIVCCGICQADCTQIARDSPVTPSRLAVGVLASALCPALRVRGIGTKILTLRLQVTSLSYLTAQVLFMLCVRVYVCVMARMWQSGGDS